MLIFPVSISSSWNRLIYSFKDHQCAIETQHFWNQMCYSSPKSAFPCPSSLPCLPFSHEALPVNHQLLRPTTFMSSCQLTLISNEFNSKFWNLYIQHITISTIQLTKSSTWITAKPVLRYSHSLLSPILPVLMLCYAMLSHFSRVWLCVTPKTVAYQAPPIPGILQARTLEWVAISFSNAWKWKVKVKSLSRVRLLATTMDFSLPGSSIHGIFQARVLEWGAIAFSIQCLYSPSKNLPLTMAGQTVPVYTLSLFPVFFPSKNSTLSYVLNHVSYLYFAAFLKLSQSPGRFMKRQITGPHPPAKSFRFSSSRRGLRISISNRSQVMRILLVHGSHFEKHCLTECELLESRAIMF